MDIQKRKVSELVPNPQNVRKHNTNQIQEFVKSIKNFGVIRPIVIVDHHGDRDEDIYGTITHNRARGTHLLEPMKKIVKELLASGKSVAEISKQLGMKPEEVFRLSDFSREDFLKMLIGNKMTYSEAYVIRNV